MNPTRIAAAWLLWLPLGVISATAIQSDSEINDKHWQNNPRIVAIRKIVNLAQTEVRNGAFKTEHRICDEGWFSRLRIARDSKGTVRWYQHYQEGEDSSWDNNYYYDDAGRLRFVLMTSYAINATREQHRAYFDESGRLIYHGRRVLKGPGYFGPPVEDLKALVHMDPKKDFAEATQGCKEVKPSAKHRTRKQTAFEIQYRRSVIQYAKGGLAMSCHFNKDTLTFAGSTPLAQAKCLLRHVSPGGDLEPALDHLPEPLETLIGAAVTIDKHRLRSYLSSRPKPISESEIGGSLDEPLSRARNNSADAPFAKYLVIHDTSSPNLCEMTEFPANINDADWTWKNTKWNSVARYQDARDAHLFITRDGQSVAPQGRTFRTPWRATKLELPNADTRAKGLFLHIENVQPRRCKPDMSQPGGLTPDRRYHKLKDGQWECRNDHFAPNPGLSDPQLDRLALVYVAASVRRGTWLIPAYHAAVDEGITDGHDDPQFFDLNRWAECIRMLLEAVG